MAGRGMNMLVENLGGFLWTAAAFVVALSIIVAVHEYGHYIVGRWSGIRAEVFSLGFGPRLFARRDRRGTLWQVAAIPLGGYVRFLGDANAASAGTGQAVAQAWLQRFRALPKDRGARTLFANLDVLGAEKNRAKIGRNGSWWEPGEVAPERAPDLSNAAGAS
mgnify:CR=1 FL=1